MSTSTCAKVIYWRARPGQFDAYTEYLRTEVEPIDHAAQQQGVLTRFATLVDRRADAPWTHMRIFEFADAAQRERLHAGLAAVMQALLPDAPTLMELGVFDGPADYWMGLMGPPGMPQALVQKLNAAVAKMLATPEMAQFAANGGGEVAPGTPEQFSKLLVDEQRRWAEVIRRNNIRAE